MMQEGNEPSASVRPATDDPPIDGQHDCQQLSQPSKNRQRRYRQQDYSRKVLWVKQIN